MTCFGHSAIQYLNTADLDNATVLKCLTNLNIFRNAVTGQRIRINYGALNVEEFGSVYEGLLEFDPCITESNGRMVFSFVKGTARSASGTHYTPD